MAEHGNSKGMPAWLRQQIEDAEVDGVGISADASFGPVEHHAISKGETVTYAHVLVSVGDVGVRWRVEPDGDPNDLAPSGRTVRHAVRYVARKAGLPNPYERREDYPAWLRLQLEEAKAAGIELEVIQHASDWAGVRVRWSTIDIHRHIEEVDGMTLRQQIASYASRIKLPNPYDQPTTEKAPGRPLQVGDRVRDICEKSARCGQVVRVDRVDPEDTQYPYLCGALWYRPDELERLEEDAAPVEPADDTTADQDEGRACFTCGTALEGRWSRVLDSDGRRQCGDCKAEHDRAQPHGDNCQCDTCVSPPLRDPERHETEVERLTRERDEWRDKYMELAADKDDMVATFAAGLDAAYGAREERRRVDANLRSVFAITETSEDG